jgi:LuxR family maltose regulon positive regulatory protein
MPAPLLVTKYHLPPPAVQRVARLRLGLRLDELLLPGKRLGLVSALAGSGKTTLVRAWVEQHSGFRNVDQKPLQRTAWLSLDEEDNDPAIFLSYLVAALKAACPEIDPLPIPLAAPGIAYTFPPVRSVMAELVNQLSGLRGLVLLVLDDYQAISAPAIHEGMAFLLDHLPDNVRLVIATRAESLLPISRLRGRGQLVEIRESDLRFTASESTAFLNEIMGLQLSPAEIELLVERTEGWATGLQMAALALRSLPEADVKIQEFIRTFSSSHRFVLDYLMDEVFSSLPAQMRSFLLNTAILDRFCAGLCKAVVGPVPAGVEEEDAIEQQLSSLVQANLFIIPLDEERRWYRYHHLFAELLRSRLRQEFTPGEIADRQQRAGAWFAEQGLMQEAVHYLLQASDFERAADLIEKCAQEVISGGRLTLLTHWLASLPASVYAGRPRLRIFQALTSFLKGDAANAITILEVTGHDLAGLPEDDRTRALKRELISILAMSFIAGGNAPRILPLIEDALASIPEAEMIPRARLLFAQGMTYAMSSDRRYYTLINQAFDLAQKAGDVYLAANILNMQAMGAVFFQAQLHTAWQLYSEIIRMCLPASGVSSPLPASLGYVGQAAIALEWNDLDRATDLLDKGAELSRQGEQINLTYSALLTRARLKRARGDLPAALADLEEAASKRAFDDNIAAVAQLAQAQVRLNLAAGQLEQAMQCAAGAGVPPASRPGPGLPALVQEVWSVMQARVLLAQGRPAEALALLDPIVPQAKGTGRMTQAVEGSLCQALANHALRRDALEPLRLALNAAQAQGITRLFLEFEDPMRDLLLAYHSRLGELTGEADRLLHLLGLPVSTSSSELVEPLTGREMDVLRLLCEGRSNQEIAAALYLSLSAVKKYTGNLYGKLGVNSRAQAIAKAHELHLV